MLSERETMVQIIFEMCWKLIFKMFLSGFCSLSSNLRAALVNDSTEDRQEKREHEFWQGIGLRVYVCVDSIQK